MHCSKQSVSLSHYMLIDPPGHGRIGGHIFTHSVRTSVRPWNDRYLWFNFSGSSSTYMWPVLYSYLAICLAPFTTFCGSSIQKLEPCRGFWTVATDKKILTQKRWRQSKLALQSDWNFISRWEKSLLASSNALSSSKKFSHLWKMSFEEISWNSKLLRFQSNCQFLWIFSSQFVGKKWKKLAKYCYLVKFTKNQQKTLL